MRHAKPTLDLDALDLEDDQGPFIVTWGNRIYSIENPRRLHFEDVDEMLAEGRSGAVVEALSRLISEADRGAFLASQWPTFKLDALIGSCMEHFGLPPGWLTETPGS